ncbi:MFS transporter [Streptomyces sp. SL13]|uniref:MFS transporter n=1 Tax=Streptantibioticus silvisoli TaxID=2705255 RepID=A0AA90H6V7_9ACTN|nr:MFS transporter [Streptantibioticus silvisoli]MDI5971659.1 MFS transporter [Streptantibioticus silvisoli]
MAGTTTAGSWKSKAPATPGRRAGSPPGGTPRQRVSPDGALPGGPGAAPAPAGPANRWTVLLVLCVSLLFVALDSTVLHVAIPALTEALRPGPVQLLWIVDAYPLAAASLLILFGTLGDRVGRRRVLLLGYALFAVASAVASMASDASVLIGARALLGAGGAMIMPATLSIVRQVFPDRRERALAIGLWSAVAAVGAAVGPVLGGFMVQHYWWGSVFLINIPLMAAIWPLARWLVPESTGDRDGPWDLLGAAMAGLGILGAIVGIKRLGAGASPLDPPTLVSLVVGVALLVLFVRRQRRLKHPLIDMSMFSRPAFSTSVGCIVVAMLALVGLELIAVQYLQLVLGLHPMQTGLRMLPLTFAAMAAGLLGSKVLHRVGPRLMVVTGFTLTASAVLALTVMGEHDRPLLLTAAFVLLGFGLETTLFGAYESMLSECPAGQAGGAAAIGETAYQLGAGLGIALLGSVMNAFYAPGVRHLPGVPRADSRGAGHSLGEAYDLSHQLGGRPGAVLRDAARQSFVHGLHVTLVVSAVLLLLGAAAALRLPRAFDGSADPHAIACGGTSEPGTEATEPAGPTGSAEPTDEAATGSGAEAARVGAQAEGRVGAKSRV